MAIPVSTQEHVFCNSMGWSTREPNGHSFRDTHSSWISTCDETFISLLGKFRDFSLKHKTKIFILLKETFKAFHMSNFSATGWLGQDENKQLAITW